ncbi:hypothetical protein BSL78_11618 [Apostichopus japonicus]|uniref:Uncharacterized protein n=1 Tax=Stichopus japonicus TaxID=307972 RepID=A0A2G8KTZ5_STIJA|nr:hypothetical protein BSL78_11618 [Apostichopus japonicus]
MEILIFQDFPVFHITSITHSSWSKQNLCLKPEDREGALRRDLNISKAESLRWSSASVRRPIPRLLLPLRPGSSTQWYSWKVDTPRREKKTKIRSSNTDGATSFREKFGDEMVFPSGSNYQEEKVDEEELRETLNVNGNDGTTEQDEKLEVSTQNVDETSKSPNTENTVNLDTNDVNNNLEMVKSDLPSGGAVDNETFITQVVEENDNLTESNKGDASNQQEIVEDNIEPEKMSSLVRNGRNSETAGDGNIAELVNKETHDERMPNFENDSSSNQNEITDQRDKVIETVTECHANDKDVVTHDVQKEEMNKTEDGEGYIVAMDTNALDNVDQRGSVDSSTELASSAKETDRNAHISDELPVANEALEVEEEIRPEKESIKDENEMIKDENNVDSVEG